MNKSHLVRNILLGTALLLVGLKFANLVPYLVEWGNGGVQHSLYPFQYAAYGLCLLNFLLDAQNLKRLLQKHIVRVFAIPVSIFAVERHTPQETAFGEYTYSFHVSPNKLLYGARLK